MANNRMYLKCLLCKEKYYIAKYYPSTGWYQNNDAELSDFLQKHSPFVKRNDNGGYDPSASNVAHGTPDNKAIMLGETFSFLYE